MTEHVRTQFHVCLSGDLGCSGIAPCTPCWEHVKRAVLPGAMYAGGFNGGPDQSTAFLEGYAAGWRRLEMALNHDVDLRPMLRVTDVGAIQEGILRFEAARTEGAGQGPPEAASFDTSFEHPPVDIEAAQMEVPSPMLSPVEVRRVEKPPSAVEVRKVVEDRRDESERTRIAQLAQPMDAEEIAAAAAPAVVGSVMGPDFVPAAERARRGLEGSSEEEVVG